MANRRPRSTVVALLVCLMTVSSCAYRYRFRTELPPSDVRKSETHHMAFWGHKSGAEFDLESACPNGVSEFGSHISFLNWLPSFLTIGLYTPRTVYAICADNQQAR
jgi:hypothetical protein